MTKSSIFQLPTTPSTVDQEVLVKVEGVSKKFCRSLKRSLWYGICDIASELNPLRGNELQAERGSELRVDGCKLEVPYLQQPTFNSGEAGRLQPATANPQLSPPLRPGEFWAVNDVSFELRRGECLGLIGHNGAGKTTLLKMLNGLIKPDRGRIEMNGRVGALIALGAGFNPILTGRENIYINGAVLGLSKKEINEKIDEIIDFAEIGEFIDMPVQNYSSGMTVRLGFAVATALNPDVLILDEVLAVGDARFRHKCYHRINKLMKNSAVIFVSHSMDYVAAICRSVALMQHGKMSFYRDPVKGIDAYNKLNTDDETESTDGGAVFEIYAPILSAKVKLPESCIQHGEGLPVEIEIESAELVQDLTVSFTANDRQERPVMNWNLTRTGTVWNLPKGQSVFRFLIDPLLLHPGRYSWNLWIGRKGSIEALVYSMRAGHFNVAWSWNLVAGIPYQPLATNVTIESR
jgi:lipopolysaccharide transport system ATP-binding protein